MTQSRLTRLFGAAACAVLLGLGPGSATAALSGTWGCLGTVTFSFIPTGKTQPQTLTESLLIRLAFSPSAANVVSAVGFFGTGGVEVCRFAAAGSVAVAANGVGLLTLRIGDSVEEDNDFSCLALIGATASPVTLNFHLVTVKGNTQFYFMGKDDFLTPPSPDKGDVFAESGECTQQ